MNQTPSSYPDLPVQAAETGSDGVPVIPLPNPGEGGPVNDLNSSGGSNDVGATPVIPLPNPGEGGPVNDLNSSGGGYFYPGSGNLPPVFRPVFPGGSSVITIIPGISFPCFQCNASSSLGKLRVLNASSGYPDFTVSLGSRLVASQLANGDLTSYLQTTPGSFIMTVSGPNGYVYIRKTINVSSGSPMTVAIINTAGGLDLLEISDQSCSSPSGTSCMRVANLSINAGPFDITAENQAGSYDAFTNVRYQEVTPYISLYPGWYQIYVSRTGSYTGNAIAAAYASLSANTSYTLYLFNAAAAVDGIRALIVSN